MNTTMAIITGITNSTGQGKNSTSSRLLLDSYRIDPAARRPGGSGEVLLDEASMAPSRVGTRSAATVEHIWHATGHPARAGLNVWRPCEQLGWPRQTMMLEAAAAALHLAETGAIAARGTLAPLLAREPHRPAYYGDRPAPAACNRKREWERAQEEVSAALEAARTDPGTARQMLTLCTFSCRTLAAFHRERQHLIGTGHPLATPLRPP